MSQSVTFKFSTIPTISAESGQAGLWKGWLPTAIGYSAQGAFKFGLYEYFKDFYANLAGEENAAKYKGLIYLAGSASAEFFADIALSPMEMVKVKVQTSPAGTFPTEFGPALAKMNEMKAETRFPFGSLVPLWSRQIPIPGRSSSVSKSVSKCSILILIIFWIFLPVDSQFEFVLVLFWVNPAQC